MTLSRLLPSCLIISLFYLSACQKELSIELGNSGNNGGGNNGGNNGNNNASCNNTIMKLKKLQSIVTPDDYLEAEWNTNGTIKMVRMNVQFSEHRTATYVYENNRIKEAVLRDIQTGDVYDTAVFHYNAAGNVDSMYLKNDDWFDLKLNWVNGKLVKVIRWSGNGTSRGIMFYLDVETDAKGNPTKVVEWWNGLNGFEKESTFTYTHDDRKNPFMDIAPYLFYLDDEYNIFWYWGPNNYTNQRYIDHAGTGVDITTGFKFTYNNNCYPSSSQVTLGGVAPFPGDDYNYTYY